MPVAHNVNDTERTDDIKISENTTFDGLMLSNETLKGLNSSGFVKPSPVQLRAIPLGKCGFDLIVEAKSGTGKTAVFGIIALEMIIKNGGFQVLILAPTREIASQIGHVLKTIGSAHDDLNVVIVMGGTNINDDIKRLKGKKFQILVGSPGRILHLIKKNVISTRSVRLLVLDEADKLMEDSFQSDINYIFSQLPDRKQLIAASATYTIELRKFLENYMRTPSHICPHISNILLGVTQNIVLVSYHDNSVRQNKIKLEKAIEILSRTSFKQCLIFCQYQIRAQSICESLTHEGWPSEFLAGSQNQSDRLKSLEKLQSFACRILVATDLAARGIDASNVDLVINIDIPNDYSTYLHRIGRAGRYGSKGIAITILTCKEESIFNEMINSLGESNIPQLDILEKCDINSNNASVSKLPSEDHQAKITTTENNTNSSYLSLIGAMNNNKKIHCESFDELTESLENFNIDNEIKFSADNFNLSKFIDSQIIVSSPPDDPINTSFVKNNISKLQRKKKKSTVSYARDKSKAYSNDSSSQCDEIEYRNLYKSKPSRKNRCQSIESTSDSSSNTNIDFNCNINSNIKYGEYVLWRQRLDALTKQIYQAVYIKTLSDIDRQLYS